MLIEKGPEHHLCALQHHYRYSYEIDIAKELSPVKKKKTWTKKKKDEEEKKKFLFACSLKAKSLDVLWLMTDSRGTS